MKKILSVIGYIFTVLFAWSAIYYIAHGYFGLFLSFLLLTIVVCPAIHDLLNNKLNVPKKFKTVAVIITVIVSLLISSCSSRPEEIETNDNEPETTTIEETTAVVETTTEETVIEETTEETTIEETTEETTIEETTEETTIKETETETETTELSHELVQATIKLAMSDLFDDITVEYDEESDTYICNITVPGLTADAMAVIAGQLDKSEWDTMIDNVVSNNKQKYKELQDIDEGANLAYFLLNDVNKDNTLVTVMDGVVLNDVVNDSID